MAIKVIYTNAYGDSVEFSASSGIRITSIDGLTSNEINLSESTVNNQVGSSITGKSVQAKDLTIEGRYHYKPSIRKTLLAVILPGVTATLRYIDDLAEIDVYWVVIPKQTPVISINPVWQNFQFVVRVPFPYPRSHISNVTYFNYLKSRFRFKQAYSSTQKWKISERTYQPLQTIKNKGSLETGFIVRMTATAEVKAPKIVKVDTQETIEFPNLTLQSGETLEINTHDNEKYCHLIKEDSVVNAFPDMSYESTFFKLNKGDNVIRYSSETNEKSLEVVLTFDEVMAGI
nr:MAG TPA: tail protein [Caudoviricetes sp.]